MEKRIVIVDMDGCLAFTHKREHLILGEKAYWDQFYEESINDDVNSSLVEILRLLNDRYDIYIVSGRSEQYESIYFDWLLKHQVVWQKVFWRGVRDFRPDEDIKEELILGGAINPEEILCVFDGRPRAVEMWRRHGVPCYHPLIAEF